MARNPDSLSGPRHPTRREPPPFRTLAVADLTPLSPHMVRVTLSGPALEGFDPPDPAASVRLLLPSPGSQDLVLPAWTGNEFLLPDGARPIIRTFTPRRYDPDTRELDIDIVRHAGGAASDWVGAARRGDPAAVSGPGRGYHIDPGAAGFVLAGDETAIPAIGQILEAVDPTTPIRVIIEIAHPDARVDLPAHPGADIDWVERRPGELPGGALLDALTRTAVTPGTHAWVAGEAGSLVAVRRHLFEDLGLERARVTVRGYWKHGR